IPHRSHRGGAADWRTSPGVVAQARWSEPPLRRMAAFVAAAPPGPPAPVMTGGFALPQRTGRAATTDAVWSLLFLDSGEEPICLQLTIQIFSRVERSSSRRSPSWRICALG